MDDKLLLPCPFCGGEADIEEISGNPFTNEPYTWAVGCKDCNIGWYKETKEDAIAAWNRRADAVPVVRGEWKLYGNDDDSGMSYWCTACNFQLSEDLFYSGYKNGRWIENGVFKYCPNCGAKMEANQDE